MYDMYQEEILDHYKSPKNFGTLSNVSIEHKESNPICGDAFKFQLKIAKGNIEDIAFSGSGCAISTAAASMLSERVKGGSLKEMYTLTKDDILEMLGIPISPVRLNCALLGWDTFRNAIRMYVEYGDLDE